MPEPWTNFEPANRWKIESPYWRAVPHVGNNSDKGLIQTRTTGRHVIQESDSAEPDDVISGLCAEFEHQWESQPDPPSIQPLLDCAPDKFKEHCFRRLLLTDIAERNKRQLDAGFELYSKEYPAFYAVVEEVLSSIDFRLSRTTASPTSADCETKSLNDFEVGRDVSIESIPSQIDRYAIEKELGAGGYGTVYLARDTRLQREVALKLLHAARAASAEAVQNFFEEAQTVAALDHPGIVPIYDFPQIDGQYFVVSRYIDGETLTQRQQRSPVTIAETVALIIHLAETLGFVHDHQIVHRDVKPSNILLSKEGNCYLTDFGLALRDSHFGMEPGQMGTVFYMSPEQARGEAHLVDASCDLFSLGVVMYELLTGNRPFVGTDWQRVMTLICSHEPVPPRQRVPEIPRELQRICLKMLQKRRKDRYSSTAALVEDLRHFIALEPELPDVSPITTGVLNPASSTNSHSSRNFGIVPRGLRSFDREDAVFFRELLPGPTDRDGIPDSLHFWKSRIETPESDRFRVGVIYGPSGSGKSSFIKAGLVPLLDNRIAVAFTEAAEGQTAARTLHRLRSFYQDIPNDLDLAGSLSWVRQNQGGNSGRRLLIVIDQFEQWLHSWDGSDNADMALALRQCDGDFMQAILLVRDDFWMPVSKFADAVGVNLVPSNNLAMVDLFDLRHARKVMTEYGRAHKRLPVDDSLSRSQSLFLDEAVTGLAKNERVIPVQLAVFSEIMKGKDWDQKSLRDLGGVEGVGVQFLEESFSSPRTPAANRIHEKAAQAILHSLLPGTDTDIKGATRSRSELQQLAGYQNRDKMFDQLIQVLDNDLRLITPVQADDESVSSEDNRHYQLTHDYLVPAVREWSYRRQTQTRTGRALLRLADRTEIWKTRQDSAHLPSWWEWASIVLFTRRRQRSADQEKLMKAANRRYSLLSGLLLLLLLFCAGVGREWNRRTEGLMLVEHLQTVSSDDAPSVLDSLDDYDYWTANPIRQLADDHPVSSRAGRRARLRLLRKDPGNASLSQLLANEISSVSAEEFRLLHGELKKSDHWNTISEGYWRLLDSDAADGNKLRAAIMLSHANDDARWKKIASDTVRHLIQQVLEDPRSASIYYELLSPVANQLRDGLVNTFVNRETSTEVRQIAMGCFVDFFADDAETLIDGLLNADPFQVPILLKHYEANRESVQSNLRAVSSQPPSIESEEREQILSSTRQANAAALLLLGGIDEHIWQLLKNSPMPETRSKLIERIAQIRVPSTKILERLRREKDSGILSALMLIFGTWQDNEIPTADLDEVVRIAKEHFRHHPHAGVHSAAEWMLRKHDFQDWIYETAAELCDQPVPDGQEWQIIDPLGTTLIAVNSPHGYVLQVSAKEVTFEQFTTLITDTARNRIDSHPRFPMNLLGWHDAVNYCRKLTAALGLPETQQIYPEYSIENEEQRPHKDSNIRKGFRLPYRWEFRQTYAGQSQQKYAFGQDSTLLPVYENVLRSKNQVEECGMRKPTPRGFFGLLGNTSEWCNLPLDVRNYLRRPIYGGHFESSVEDIEHRQEKGHETKEQQYHSIGFRVSRLLQSAAEARKQSEKKAKEDDGNN